MIIGIGMDVVEIDRFEKALGRSGERLRQRLFTEGEQDYCEAFPNPAARFAVRFAAKEAFSKAIGKGIAHGIQWIDVEVLREDSGRPLLLLHRRALEIFEEIGGKSLHLTMTHSRGVAAATVIIEG